MEKKNIAGYLAGLASIGTGAYIGGRGLVGFLVGVNEVAKSSIVIDALPAVMNSLPQLGIAVGGTILAGIGVKSIINTYRGNKKTKMQNDVKEIKSEVNKLREDLTRGIEKTPVVQPENIAKKEAKEAKVR